MIRKLADGEARERLIIWIRRRIEEFGITVDALATSIEQDVANRPVYRDAKGNDWNGVGAMPDWLAAARHAGVDPEFFRIESRPQPQVSAERRQADLFD